MGFVLLLLGSVPWATPAVLSDRADPRSETQAGRDLSSGDGPDFPSSMDDSERYLLEDIAMIAEQEGWTFEEGVRRLRPQDDYVELFGRLKALYPDTFSGAWTEDREDDTYRFVRFVGAVPPEARAQAEAAGLPVVFRDDGVYSEAEREQRQKVIVRQIIRDLDDTSLRWYMVGTGSGPDERVQVWVARPTECRGHGRCDDRLREELPESARGPEVFVRFTDESFNFGTD